MNLVVVNSEGLQRKYEGAIDHAEIDRVVDGKIEEARPTFHMRGFRPGKVPARLLKARFGKSLTGEAITELVEEAVKRHLEETGEKPIRSPNVDLANEEASGESIKFSVDYECEPAYPELDFSEIQVERPVLKDIEDVINQDFEKFIQSLGSVPVDTEPGEEADEDDIVTINLKVLVDGKERDELAAEGLDVRVAPPDVDHPFASKLKGMRSGDTRTVTAPLPDTLARDDGGMADYEIQAMDVKKTKKLQTREQVEEAHGAEQLASIEAQLRQRRESWISYWTERLVNQKLLDELDERLEFELPPSMLNSEMENVRNALLQDAQQAASRQANAAEAAQESAEEPPADADPREADVSDSLPEASAEERPKESSEHQPDAAAGKAEQAPVDEEEVGRLATRRLKLGLYLNDLAGKKELTPSQQEVENWYRGRSRTEEEFEQYRQALQERKDLWVYAAGQLIESKALRYVAELATKQDLEVDLDAFTARVRDLTTETEEEADPEDMDNLPEGAG